MVLSYIFGAWRAKPGKCVRGEFAKQTTLGTLFSRYLDGPCLDPVWSLMSVIGHCFGTNWEHWRRGPEKDRQTGRFCEEGSVQYRHVCILARGCGHWPNESERRSQWLKHL